MLKVEIYFISDYSKSGEGFHRFVDPEDKVIVFYSNLLGRVLFYPV